MTASPGHSDELKPRLSRKRIVLVYAARRPSVFKWMKRAGVTLGAAGLCLLGASSGLQVAVANGDTRTLSFFHLHTKESITVTFKRNGRYDDAGLKQLNWFLRDWRRDAQIRMEPHLFDILWETYREVGGTRPIEIISAYRSPETNSMLRARSSGVAQTSQHTMGQAIDFHIPGVPLEKVRNVGLRLQRGGVGFYPTSGSPFVHMDVGTVRHWPRMTHDQLAKVFPDGRTVHIPSDGQPLAGYALALADVERRGSRPSSVSLAAARDAGAITTANLSAAAQKPRRGLLDGLFGGSNEAEDEPAAATPAPPKPVAVAMAPKPVAVEPIVPMPSSRPKPAPVQVAQVVPVSQPVPAPAPAAFAAVLPKARPAQPQVKPAEPQIAPVQVAAAALPDNLFKSRGYWQGAVNSGVLYGTVDQPFQVASADQDNPLALGYAAPIEPAPPSPARARPMGAALPQAPREALAANTTVAQKAAPAPAIMTSGAQQPDSPWLRAAMLTPSVSGYMTATQLGEIDLRPLRTLLHKPSEALLMSFSADPHLGLAAHQFSGSAVVFLATATFTGQTTASLR